MKAFEDIAVEHGQEVMIANTNYDPVRMESCVIRMLQRKVDGVAIMTSEMDDRLIEVFSRRHVPLVFMDAGMPGVGVSSVRIDYPAGVAQAMDHLIGLGHERIAFISGPLSLTSARTRFRAFTEGLERSHLKGNPNLIQEGNHRVDGGHAAMQRILSSGAKPTAILASNDLTAIGAMGAIYEHGLRVPEDISVIGYRRYFVERVYAAGVDYASAAAWGDCYGSLSRAVSLSRTGRDKAWARGGVSDPA